MRGVVSTAVHLSGSADRARSSVKLNLGEIFTPVAALRQPSIRSGFPQGQCVETGFPRDKQGLSRLARQHIQGSTDTELDTVSALVLSAAASSPARLVSAA